MIVFDAVFLVVVNVVVVAAVVVVYLLLHPIFGQTMLVTPVTAFQSYIATNKGEQGLISSTFYVQLLHSRSPKSQNDNADSTVFFACSGSTIVKALHRMLMKLTPGVNPIEEI